MISRIIRESPNQPKSDGNNDADAYRCRAVANRQASQLLLFRWCHDTCYYSGNAKRQEQKAASNCQDLVLGASRRPRKAEKHLTRRSSATALGARLRSNWKYTNQDRHRRQRQRAVGWSDWLDEFWQSRHNNGSFPRVVADENAKAVV